MYVITHYSFSPSLVSSPFGFVTGWWKIVPNFLQEAAVIWLSGQKRILKTGQILMTLLFPTVIIHQSQSLEMFHKAPQQSELIFKQQKNYRLFELLNTATYNINRSWQHQTRKWECFKQSQQFQKHLQRIRISCSKTWARGQDIREPNSKD